VDKEGLSGLEAVVRAAGLSRSARAEIASGGWPGEPGKGDGSPVTVADFGAQAIVCKRIAESFPGDAIMAEEDGALLRDTVNAKVLSAVTRYVRGQMCRADEESVCAWVDAARGNVSRLAPRPPVRDSGGR
jgi:3'(2'), 5'-bisphosphate nucleotidase